MKIQHIRSATFKIEYAGKTILVDPMLSPKGVLPSFGNIAPNPTVELPLPIDKILAGVDIVLVTHIHPDHYDEAAIEAISKDLPLYCQPVDEDSIKGNGFLDVRPVEDHLQADGFSLDRTGGFHGSGEVEKLMGAVSGFVLTSESEPKLYIVGDSIWVQEVESAIEQFQPEVIVTNSGGAIIPDYEDTPILMDEKETIQVAEKAPNATVVSVHMEALDHCKVTRTSLREAADAAGVAPNRLLIPKDGEELIL